MFFMDKNTPHCKLSIVKQLVEADQVRTTRSAREGAAALGFDFDEMLAVVIALTTKVFLRARQHMMITRYGRTCIGP